MAALSGNCRAITPTKAIPGHGSGFFDRLTTHFLLVDWKEVNIANASNPPALVPPNREGM